MIDNKRPTLDARRIRWIAFDAVDTLIEPAPSVAAIYHLVGQRHGSRYAVDEVRMRFRRVFSELEREGLLNCDCQDAADRWHTCEARETLRWRTIVESVLDDVSSPEACFADLFAHFGRPAAWRCFPEVGRTLAALRKAGFRLAVSSNFDARLNAVMDGLPELDPIELRVVSSEVGHRKPSARFFDALLRAAASSPGEMLFIGDNPETDVAAAAAAGLPGLQIDRAPGKSKTDRLHSLEDLNDILRR